MDEQITARVEAVLNVLIRERVFEDVAFDKILKHLESAVLGVVRAEMTALWASFMAQLAERDARVSPSSSRDDVEPVLPLRDRALRMFTQAPGGMDGYEAALRAIDCVIAEMSGQHELAPLTHEEECQLMVVIREHRRHAMLDAAYAVIEWHESIRPARVARAKQ